MNSSTLLTGSCDLSISSDLTKANSTLCEMEIRHYLFHGKLFDLNFDLAAVRIFIISIKSRARCERTSSGTGLSSATSLRVGSITT